MILRSLLQEAVPHKFAPYSISDADTLAFRQWKPGDPVGLKYSVGGEFSRNSRTALPKAVVKDDTLGLGAPRCSNYDDPTSGLSGFSDLLGRLNGKSEEQVQKTQRARATLARGKYFERRGMVHFVKGGLLEHEEVWEEDRAKQRQSKQDESSDVKRYDRPPSFPTRDIPHELTVPEHLCTDQSESRRLAKAQKRARKQKRRMKKLYKIQPGSSPEYDKLEKGDIRKHPDVMEDASNPRISRALTDRVGSGEASVAAIGTRAGGRHLVRQRYIQQKKLAILDTKSLNEVRASNVCTCARA